MQPSAPALMTFSRRDMHIADASIAVAAADQPSYARGMRDPEPIVFSVKDDTSLREARRLEHEQNHTLVILRQSTDRRIRTWPEIVQR